MDDIRELESGDEVRLESGDSFYGVIRGTVIGMQAPGEETIVDVQTAGDSGNGPVASKDHFLIDLVEVRQLENSDNIYAVGLTVNEYTEEIGDLQQVSVLDGE